MAMTTYPLNNITYQAEDAELFHCTRTSGIWEKDNFPLTVSGTNNTVTVGKGIAWIKNEEFAGKVAAHKESKSIDMGIANSTQARIDAIVIQFDANANATDIIKKTGTASANPQPPALVRSGNIYELHLYHILRPAGSTRITQNNVTDQRLNTKWCGLMTDAVTSLDTTLLDRVKLLEYMSVNNDYVSPITTNDKDVSQILTDDENAVILANWKYMEV